MAKEVAVKKRALIDQASRNMFIFVAIASVILGLTIVASTYIIRQISFNAKVIGEKSKVIADYDSSIKNLPNLASSVQALSENADLEYIAQTRDVKCETFEGQTITDIEALRECSALRVIPDALPAATADENKTTTTVASLGEIFLKSGISQDSLNPDSSSSNSAVTGLSVIPLRFSVSGSVTSVRTFLDDYFERSIRTFELSSVTLEWRGDDSLLLSAQASAYYTQPQVAELKTRKVCADEESDACKAKKGTTKK